MGRRDNLLVVLCCIVHVFHSHGAFEGYQMLSVSPTQVEHVKLLHDLAENYVDVDFWQEPTLNHTGIMVVPPGLVSIVQDAMNDAGIKWTAVQVDLPGMVEASMATHSLPRTAAMAGRLGGDVIDHTNYHNYDMIESYLYMLKDKYPDNLDLSYLNYLTHDGRRVIMAKVHGGTSRMATKPSIIIESGIHAREWVSPAATLYVMEKMLQQNQQGDPKASLMLSTYDWYIVPVTNPDGYDFSRKSQKNRLWRKNRRIMSSRCVGVDLNRNFDFRHGTTGISWHCDSDIYPGTQGFSEPETANIRDLFYDLKDSLVSYISIHAYSQLLLVPWGFYEGVLRPDNHQEIDRVAELMSDAIYTTSRKVYHVGTAYELLQYAASGASEDWAHYQKSSLYSYCYELRPDYNDHRGFLLPPEEIVPTGEELLASLAVLAQEIKL